MQQPAGQPAAPPAAGVRLPWSAIPANIKSRVEAALGGEVVQAVTQPGGFSPGVAARLLLANGSRVFVKAVSETTNAGSAALHRTEALISAALPSATPAPALIATIDSDGWVALIFDDVDGRIPAQPWLRSELDRVLDAAAAMGTLLDPAPIDAPLIGDRLDQTWRGWRRLRDAAAAGDDLAWLDPWARNNLNDLARIEGTWKQAAEGTALIHADLRADNVLLTPDRVVFVDWPHASIAAHWFDAAVMLPSAGLAGGVDPEQIATTHPLLADVDPAALTAVVAAFTGFLWWKSFTPAPPGLPTLRAFQHAQGVVALAWLRQRLNQS